MTPRLFHVGEEPDIPVFHPRLPTRKDLDPEVGLVWAIDEPRLPNFLTPRNCPRVTYHMGPQSTDADRRFFSSPTASHVVAIVHKWFEAMLNTTLYLYEFSPEGFVLQDAAAGYYVATTSQAPIAKSAVPQLLPELLRRGIEIRLLDNLWALAEEVQHSTLNWSFCRMGYAQPKK